MAIDQSTIQRLIDAATAARSHAHAPHSCYTVGAALLSNNTITTGCNLESPSLQFACCAERLALLKAVEQGLRTFQALAIVTDDAQAPCGACRQMLYEWCGDIMIIMANPTGHHEIVHLEQLLPKPFNATCSCH